MDAYSGTSRYFRKEAGGFVTMEEFQRLRPTFEGGLAFCTQAVVGSAQNDANS